jgi:glycosyltransferase involved in cell wall biosynthesis
MKILYVYTSRLPTEKAHGYQVMKMCEAFAAAGNDVLLLCPRRKNSKETKTASGIFDFYAVRKIFGIKKIFTIDLSPWPIFQAIWFRLHMAVYSASVCCWMLMHRREFDLIYSRDPFTLHALKFFRKRIGTRLAYECHDFPRRHIRSRIALANQIDAVITVTGKIKERFVDARVKGEKILVAPDAVDLAQFDLPLTRADARMKLRLASGMRMATFVGRFHTMEMEKGIPDIIRAAAELIPDFSDLFFYFIGGPLDRESRYRQIVEDLGLPQDRFVFLDQQPVRDVPIWLKASDALLMPFPNEPHFAFFMSPLKMFEYMASKRPIVASKLSVIMEILRHEENALLGAPGDAAGIAANIKEILDNPALSEKVSSKAYDDVRVHTWDKRGKRILIFICENREGPI